MCSVRWPDGSEFHGEFVHGEMTGYGRYIFKKVADGRWDDAAEFRGARERREGEARDTRAEGVQLRGTSPRAQMLFEFRHIHQGLPLLPSTCIHTHTHTLHTHTHSLSLSAPLSHSLSHTNTHAYQGYSKV
jgi:hypothetical protein